jgi:cytochrome c553
MTPTRLPPFWKSLSFAAAAVVGGAAAGSIAIGFVLLPLLQANDQHLSVWQRICHAAGLEASRPDEQPPMAATVTTSKVVVVPHMLMKQAAASVGHGATLAQQCGSCHGARGLSGADIPNLAGQYPAVIYKQLLDYASGARENAIMSPRVAALSDADMRDLAAFYAYLPRQPGAANGAAPRIVASGSPMHSIAPCGACHGGIDYKTGSPWLEGEPSAYLRAQLVAFAAGSRHNDISAQMRNVARGMSPAEMDAAAAYYAGPP